MVTYNGDIHDIHDDKLTLEYLADFKRILNKHNRTIMEEDNYGKQFRMDLLRDLISKYSI